MTTEIKMYQARLAELRGKIWKELEGLDSAALDWTPLPENTNSLMVLATHSLGAEHGWISEIIGGAAATRVRDSEFHARASSAEQLRQTLQTTARESEQVLTGLSASDLDSTRERESYGVVTVRWIILHVIEHYAEHLGQMRLTRQLGEKNSNA